MIRLITLLKALVSRGLIISYGKDDLTMGHHN